MFATDFERVGSVRRRTSVPERHLHRNRHRQVHGPIRVSDPRHAADHPKVNAVYVLNQKNASLSFPLNKLKTHLFLLKFEILLLVQNYSRIIYYIIYEYVLFNAEKVT